MDFAAVAAPNGCVAWLLANGTIAGAMDRPWMDIKLSEKYQEHFDATLKVCV